MSDTGVWKHPKKLWTKQGSLLFFTAHQPGKSILTNGHFALVIDTAKIVDCELKAGLRFKALPDTSIDRLPLKVETDTSTSYKRTRILLEEPSGILIRCYLAKGLPPTFFQDRYLDFLEKPKSLIIENGGTIAVDKLEPEFWIMPVMTGKTDNAIVELVLPFEEKKNK